VGVKFNPDDSAATETLTLTLSLQKGEGNAHPLLSPRAGERIKVRGSPKSPVEKAAGGAYKFHSTDETDRSS
jgi:hypothetical protein